MVQAIIRKTGAVGFGMTAAWTDFGQGRRKNWGCCQLEHHDHHISFAFAEDLMKD